MQRSKAKAEMNYLQKAKEQLDWILTIQQTEEEKPTIEQQTAVGNLMAQIHIAEQLERIADSADYQDSVTGWKMEREEIGK